MWVKTFLIALFYLIHTGQVACCNACHVANHFDQNNTSKQACCHQHKKPCQDGDCNGNCGHRGCTCPQTNSTYLILTSVSLEVAILILCDSNNVEWHYQEVNLSSGYASLRLPPKIDA